MDFPNYIKAGRTAMKLERIDSEKNEGHYFRINGQWGLVIDQNLNVISKGFERNKVLEITKEEWIIDEGFTEEQKKRLGLTAWQKEMLEAIQSGKKCFIPVHRAIGKNWFKNFLKEEFPEEYEKVFPEPVTDGGKAFHFAIQDDHI